MNSDAKVNEGLTVEEYRKLDQLVGKTFRTAHAETIEQISKKAGPLLSNKGDRRYREQVLMNLVIKYSSHPYTNSELQRIIRYIFSRMRDQKSPD